MTRQEVNTLLALSKALYFNAYKNMSNQDRRLLAQSWSILLQDIPGEIVLLAFFQLASKSKWPPTPAEIRQQAGSLHHEALEMIQQTRLMDEMRRLQDYESPEITSAYLKKLGAIANSIAHKTEHLACGLHGNDNSLTLAAIINSAFSGNPEDNKEIRALIMPHDALDSTD